MKGGQRLAFCLQGSPHITLPSSLSCDWETLQVVHLKKKKQPRAWRPLKKRWLLLVLLFLHTVIAQRLPTLIITRVMI